MSTLNEFDAALIRDITPDSVWRDESSRLHKVLFVIDMDHEENGLTVIYGNFDKRTRHGMRAKDWHRYMIKVTQSTE